MKIRQEILFDKQLLLSNSPIMELGETYLEFLFRQEYVHDIIMASQMLGEKIDWDELEHPESIILSKN